MAAKTKAEEDICEEVITLEVENQNLKHLVEQGVECISYDNLSLSEKLKFDTQQRIEELELDGVAHVFSGNEDFRKHAWNCWKQATMLRERNAIPKNILPQSEWEKIAFNNRREFQTFEDLFRLFPEEQLRWQMQAFFTFQRISRKYYCFPDSFIVENLFQFALQGWEDRGFTRPWAFAISLYLFELFGKTEFLHQLVSNPSESKDVVHSTFTEFFNILQHPQRNQFDLTEPDTLMTFDHLMTSLEFSFAYQAKVRDHAPNRQSKTNLDLKIKSKVVKLKDISKLILIILELLVSLPKSENQSSQLRSELQSYIINFENKLTNQRPNLLLKACEAYQGNINDFKLIKFLLKAGANPNAVDQERCSPLHLLADCEVASCHMWGDPSYSTRAENFTSIVRVILEGRFREDQINLRGQSALECLKPLLPMYPNAQLCQLVGNFLKGVGPLSCLAAKAVRRHQLPCESLPRSLQYMVLQH